MLVYLLKSTACLAILFAFYKVFLEKESIHKLKRFYLLGALLFSLIVPGLVFTEYVESEPLNQNTYTTEEALQPPADSINVPQALETDVLDIEPLLWSIYFIGLLFFGIKFIRNLFQIFFRIRKNPKHKLAKITQVLLQEKITPHTFMSYIFLNKTKFENNQIPKEVLLHEETHAKQMHSWDVLLVELLQVIFWVNPLIYFSKKAIKLNHEFLADQAVLDKDIDATSYKNTLLSYLSPDSEKKYQTLANAINYSSIKKRFTVMKKQTSKMGIFCRSLLLLPLLAVLLVGFSEKQILEVNKSSSIQSSVAKKHITGIWLNQDNELTEFKITEMNKNLYSGFLNSDSFTFKEINNKYVLLSPELEIKKQLYFTNDNTKLIYDGKSFIRKQSTLREKLLGSWVNDQGDLKMIFQDFDIYLVVDLVEGSKKPVRYYPKKRGDTYFFTYGYEDWSFSFKNEILKDSKNNTYTKSETNSLEKASLKQIAAYNSLAKKYNTMLTKSRSIQIKKKDVDRLAYLYSLMSEKQKADAEPFPDFPEPPPAPEAPKAPEVASTQKTHVKSIFNYPAQSNSPTGPKTLITSAYAEEQLSKIINNQDPYDAVVINKSDLGLRTKSKAFLTTPQPSNKIVFVDDIYKKSNNESQNGKEQEEIIEIVEVLGSAQFTPSKLERYVLELKGKGAIFYLDDRTISPRKGMALIRSKKYEKVETHPWVSKPPEVKIYSKSE